MLLLSAGVAGYYQLKQLRPVARSLSVDAAKTLVQAFVSSPQDYCNAILHGLPEKLMRRLQSVQNAAARMITSARRRDHITLILRQLHWLPVRQRVDFKIAVLVSSFWPARHLLIWPTTVSSPLMPVLADSTQPTWRSASSIISTTTSATGALQLPCLWNTLPLNLRLCDSLGQFKQSLKIFLFGLWDHGALWH